MELIRKNVTANKASKIKTKEIKKAMNTKERWLFSFITGSGILYLFKSISVSSFFNIVCLGWSMCIWKDKVVTTG